jgi:hypothetical protein
MVERILADLHTHLIEKKVSPKDWWDKAKKLDIVAITEHVEYNPKKAYLQLKKLQPKCTILIPGMEAKTTAGHLLIYGFDESVYNIPELQKVNVPIKKALKLVNENGLVASFAHPYGYKKDSACAIIGEKETKKLLKKYGVGVEYYNGMLGSANNFVFGTQWVKKLYNFFDFMSKNKVGKITGISKKSLKIRNSLDKISEETFGRVKKAIDFSQSAYFITVGSDAHYPRVIGTAVIELKRKAKDEKDFLKMLKEKKIVWAGPNIYADEPVDNIRKKELLEGLKYITKSKLKKGIRRKKKNKLKNKRKNKLKKKFSKVRLKIKRNKK